MLSQKSISRENCFLCCGYFGRVDKEHNKYGKMTYFVEKLTISPDA